MLPAIVFKFTIIICVIAVSVVPLIFMILLIKDARRGETW